MLRCSPGSGASRLAKNYGAARQGRGASIRCVDNYMSLYVCIYAYIYIYIYIEREREI